MSKHEDDWHGYLLFIFSCIVFGFMVLAVIKLVQKSFLQIPETQKSEEALETVTPTFLYERDKEEIKEYKSNLTDVERQREELMRNLKQKMRDDQRMRN